MNDFSGAKLALFIGNELLVYLRDQQEGLIFSGMWDLPGGGREGNETPEECALRELREEFNLEIAQTKLTYKTYRLNKQGNRIYFFAAHCHEGLADKIVFGNEGQYYRLVTATEFLQSNNAIPHLQEQLKCYLAAC